MSAFRGEPPASSPLITLATHFEELRNREPEKPPQGK
jgi:hypothetical protein